MSSRLRGHLNLDDWALTARSGRSRTNRRRHQSVSCEQALYASQALATRNSTLRAHFERASAEETDHLAWTQQRRQIGAAAEVRVFRRSVKITLNS